MGPEPLAVPACRPRSSIPTLQTFDRFAVAARIRGLLAGQDGGVAGLTATRLGVSEVALRLTIDEDDPHPVVHVLVAVIRHCGVDPTWLTTGEYDRRTHRQELEDDAAVANLIVTSAMQSAVPEGRPENTLTSDGEALARRAAAFMRKS